MSANKKTRTSAGGGYAMFLAPGLLLCTAVVIVPLIATISISFTRWQGIGPMHWIGLDNYTRLFHDDNFWASFKNIGILILAMVVVPTLIGLALAAVLFDYVAKRFGPRIAAALRSSFYLPQVLPVAITGVVWGWILNPDYGALNTVLNKFGLHSLAHNWLGDPHYALPTVMVTLTWAQIGYPLVMFMAGLQRVDPELYEAAELDGAGWRQRFLRVSVPMIRPEIYVVVVTTTIATLKIFGQIFVLTGGGPGNSTLVPSYFAYKNYFQNANVGYGSAISTVLTVMIVILAVVFLRVQARNQKTEKL